MTTAATIESIAKRGLLKLKLRPKPQRAPRLANRFAASLALPEGPRLDAGKRLVDLVERPLFALDQAQRKLLVVIFGPHIGHVQGDVREVPRRVGLVAPQRFVGHLVEVAP